MKKDLILFIACFIAVTANSQTLFQEFMYPSKVNRIPNSYPTFTNTKDNGYLLAQSWPKRIDDSLNYIVQILKLDNSGTIRNEKDLIWDVNAPSQMLVCKDGSIVILGHTKINGLSKINIIKTQASGKILWSKGYTTPLIISGSAVMQDSNKLIISSDYTDISKDMWWSNAGIMTVDFNTGNLLSYNTYQTQTFTSDSNQLIKGLLPTSDGGYVEYGISNFRSNLFMKFNAGGILMWAKSVTLNNLFAAINGVVQTQDGGYVISGYVRDDNNVLRSTAFKLDAAGNVLWCKQFTSQFSSSGRDEWFSKVVMNNSGNLFISGEVWKQSKYINVLIKIDNAGNILSSKYDSILFITDFTAFSFNKNTNTFAGCGWALNDVIAPAGSTKLVTFDTAGNSCGSMANLTYAVAAFPYVVSDYPLMRAADSSITTSKFSLTTYDLGPSTVINACTQNLAKTVIPQQQFNVTILSNMINDNQLNIKVMSEINTQAELIIKGASGQVFTKQSMAITKGTITKNILLPNLLPGVYFVQVTNGAESHTGKFYKN